MEKLFYELMQVAVGQLNCLSRGPEPEEWQELYRTAQRQAVTGVCYKGVERLFEFGLRAPQDVSIDWMSETEDIRMQNAVVDKRTVTLLKKLLERKIYTSVLLGQGVARYYGAELQELRQPNGIDAFVDCGRKKAVKFVQQTGQQTVRQNHHVVWLDAWKDTPVRLLSQAVYSKNPWQNEKIQRWIRRNRQQLYKEDGEWVVPTADMNVVLVLLYLYEQFMEGSVDMRLLMDCFFVLKKKEGEFGTFQGGQDLEKVLKSLGVKTFASGVMWVMQEVFAIDAALLPLKPLENEGRFILRQVMEGRKMWQMLKHYPLQTMWNVL